jgi:DOPA 4,5-dioxygenase
MPGAALRPIAGKRGSHLDRRTLGDVGAALAGDGLRSSPGNLDHEYPARAGKSQPKSGVTVQRIKGYHAHVYYDASTLEQARELCEEAARLFPVTMGRMHQKPVGPHPDWSCQLAFEPEFVGVVLPWLALYRKGLVVFLHPLTGDELADHRDHAIWMGAVRPLNLSIFGG